MEKIERLVEIRAVDTEKRQAEFVISTESIDRHGTVFKMDGWELEAYRKNPIVSFNHSIGSEDPDMVIGLSEVFKEDNQLIGRATFEDEGDNEVADKVWTKIVKGIFKMASVGAIVHDWRWGNVEKGEDSGTIYFTRQELLEWSVVTAGSNRDAFKRITEQMDRIKDDLTPKGMTYHTKNRIREYDLIKIVTPE